QPAPRRGREAAAAAVRSHRLIGRQRESSVANNQQDPEREHRITMEIIVDCYYPEEQALGWYYYLESNLGFPFNARCIRERRSSPLDVGGEVTVVGMPPEEKCEREMFVDVEWQEDSLSVPLAQLEFVSSEADPAKTVQAIEDWHYWLRQGHRF
ncbi:MAG TPA: calcium-binding protein, partial [Longimicrobium sp.]|nr:calcium-binding protein [Longimicrobium sp.]